MLHEVTDGEKYLSQIATLKDTIPAISTAEAQASVSQEISNLQNHQRALDSSIREKLALLTENSLPAHNKTLTRQANIEPLQTILTQDSQCPAIGKDTSEEIKSTHCVTTLVGSQATELDHFPLSTPQSEHLAAQSVTDAQAHETQLGVTQKKVFTIVLDMEMPDFQPPDNVHMSSPLENKSRVSSTLDETDLNIHYLKSHALIEPQVEDTLTPIVLKEREDSQGAKVSCKGKSQANPFMQHEVLSPSKSCGAHAAETTFCLVEKQTMNSVSSAVEGEALPDTQTPAADMKQLTAADTAQSAGPGRCEREEGGNTGGETKPELPQAKAFEVPRRRCKARLLFEGSEWKVPASLEHTEGTQGQVDVIFNVFYEPRNLCSAHCHVRVITAAFHDRSFINALANGQRMVGRHANHLESIQSKLRSECVVLTAPTYKYTLVCVINPDESQVYDCDYSICIILE